MPKNIQNITKVKTRLHPYYVDLLESLRLERAEVSNKLNKIVDIKCTAETFGEGFGEDWEIYLDLIDKKYRALGQYSMFLDSEIGLLEKLMNVSY